jgi:hypothetical protein
MQNSNSLHFTCTCTTFSLPPCMCSTPVSLNLVVVQLLNLAIHVQTTTTPITTGLGRLSSLRPPGRSARTAGCCFKLACAWFGEAAPLLSWVLRSSTRVRIFSVPYRTYYPTSSPAFQPSLAIRSAHPSSYLSRRPPLIPLGALQHHLLADNLSLACYCC